MASSSGGNSRDLFSGDMDPEVAELIGAADADTDTDDVPDFGDLFEDNAPSDDEPTPAGDIDMSVTTFTRPAKTEDDPKPLFNDKNYYKTALTGEGEVSKRVHSILGQFLNAKDPQDRSMYRSRLIPAY